jgi:multiple sugar transport system ATP-binding protein
MADIIEIAHLTKSFGGAPAVDDVSLAVREGEFVTLLGPSGCGKTTTLRLIAGFEYPDAGTVLVGGEDVTDLPPYRRPVNTVFQDYALFPHMTVAQNVGYGLRIAGVTRADITKRVGEALRMVDLVEKIDAMPAELSGGQRQRVALARAIVRRPSLFLMDEPLSNLDAKLRGHMRSELKRLQNDLGITTIYVTHDQVEAMTLAHRVAVMNKGVVQQIARPRDIYDDPANLFVAGFIGSPAMNAIRGALAEGVFVAGGNRIQTGVSGTNANAVLGIHAEDCRISTPQNGALRAEVYTTELIGDHTLVTAKLGEDLLAIKAAKDFDAPIGSPIGLELPSEKQFVFDADSGARIR